MIKIVTDSSSDLSKELTDEYGISVVPLYSRFGETVYKERVDITDDEFYQKMAQSATLPSTVQPGPGDFLPVYEKLIKEADAIVSIHLSNKLSGTMNSAVQAKAMLENNPK
jgi:DegV family protein with EDD domain